MQLIGVRIQSRPNHSFKRESAVCQLRFRLLVADLYQITCGYGSDLHDRTIDRSRALVAGPSSQSSRGGRRFFSNNRGASRALRRGKRRQSVFATTGVALSQNCALKYAGRVRGSTWRHVGKGLTKESTGRSKIGKSLVSRFLSAFPPSWAACGRSLGLNRLPCAAPSAQPLQAPETLQLDRSNPQPPRRGDACPSHSGIAAHS